MADWFRWWHGTVTDAKFGVISSKVGCSLSDVIAVWAYLLEQSSECHVRGDVTRYVSVTDSVTRNDGVTEIVWALRMSNESVTGIVTELCNAGMILDGRIEAWERRQPNREDAVNTRSKTNAQRQKEYRERKKIGGNKSNAQVTQSNAQVTHQKREEQSREEQIKSLSLSAGAEKIQSDGATRKGAVCGLLRKAGMADSAPGYLTDEVWALILSKRTDEEIVELAKAKMAAKPNQRIGLKYIAPALLEDPAPMPINGNSQPRMTQHQLNQQAIAASIFGPQSGPVVPSEKLIEGEVIHGN
jgi:hypothetical protein